MERNANVKKWKRKQECEKTEAKTRRRNERAGVRFGDLEGRNELAERHEEKVKVGEGFKLLDDDLREESSGAVPDNALETCCNDTERQQRSGGEAWWPGTFDFESHFGQMTHRACLRRCCEGLILCSWQMRRE